MIIQEGINYLVTLLVPAVNIHIYLIHAELFAPHSVKFCICNCNKWTDTHVHTRTMKLQRSRS